MSMEQPGGSPFRVTYKLVKELLHKAKFRELYPDLKSPITQFLSNPGCDCHWELLNTILKDTDRLRQYFKIDIVTEEIKEPTKVSSKIIVVNTDIHSLEKELQKLPHGPKQISVARFEDQITVIIQLIH